MPVIDAACPSGVEVIGLQPETLEAGHLGYMWWCSTFIILVEFKSSGLSVMCFLPLPELPPVMKKAGAEV